MRSLLPEELSSSAAEDQQLGYLSGKMAAKRMLSAFDSTREIIEREQDRISLLDCEWRRRERAAQEAFIKPQCKLHQL